MAPQDIQEMPFSPRKVPPSPDLHATVSCHSLSRSSTGEAGLQHWAGKWGSILGFQIRVSPHILLEVDQ